MHEFSLVASLMSQAIAVAAEHGGLPIDEIRIEIGPLSGVEPILVQDAFARLAADRQLTGARLAIDEVPLQCQCEQCDGGFVLEDFHFQCPTCGTPRVRVLSGDAVRLMSVTLREPAPDARPSTACFVEAGSLPEAAP